MHLCLSGAEMQVLGEVVYLQDEGDSPGVEHAGGLGG